MLHLIGVHSSTDAFLVKQPQPQILAVYEPKAKWKVGFFQWQILVKLQIFILQLQTYSSKLV